MSDYTEPRKIVTRYLEDAIAAEKNFESQLRTMSKEGEDTAVQQIFAMHADETRSQYERLTARLEALGGSTSTIKSLLAHVFNTAPKLAQLGHDEAEKTTQNLIIAFSVENSEVAMYEAMIHAAEAAGDSQTAELARQIQQEERRTAERVWQYIAPSSRMAVHKMTGEPVSVSRY